MHFIKRIINHIQKISLLVILLLMGCGDNEHIHIKPLTTKKLNAAFHSVKEKGFLESLSLINPYGKEIVLFFEDNQKFSIKCYDLSMRITKEVNVQKGKGPGELLWLAGAAFDEHGNLYLLDGDKYCIEVFDDELRYYQTIKFHQFSLYREGISFYVDGRSLFIASTIPYPLIGINQAGEIVTSVKSSCKLNSAKIYSENSTLFCWDNATKRGYLSYIKDDNGNTSIAVYDRKLTLLQTKLLVDKKHKFRMKDTKISNGSIQLKGVEIVGDMTLGENELYILRGTGGRLSWESNEPKISRIKDLKAPYLDVIRTDFETIERLECPFLQTNWHVHIKYFNKKLFFFVNENDVEAGVYVAEP